MYKIQEWTKFTLKKKSILHMYVYCILGLMEKIRLRENASLMLYNQAKVFIQRDSVVMLVNLADILVADIFR